MLLNIIGRMLDNGFSLSRAIKDEVTFKKNSKNYPKNLDLYQKLLKNNYGLLIEEYEIMGEIAFSVEILTKDTIRRFTTYENWGFSKIGEAHQSNLELNQAKEQDYYFANTITSYIDKLRNQKIICYENYQEIINQLMSLDKTLFEKFDGLENLIQLVKK